VNRTRQTRIASALVICGLLVATVTAVAQFDGGRGYFRRGRRNDEKVPLPSDRHDIPTWPVDPAFKSDVFTFVRIKYNSDYGYGRRSGGGWLTDWPDSDLNFSFRLQQLTSLKVEPNPIQLELTDEKVFDYPFIYMLEVGALEFSEEEVVALRKYLLNGGFLMVDDHWGGAEYENFHQQIMRVFPDREPQELDITHPVFHCVFNLKQKPQIPSINVAQMNRNTGITTERPYDPEGIYPDYRAIYDDKGRMMVIICHNTDLGDGWEREGEDEWYFREFSEKKAYPMGINIIFYAMTH